MSAHPGIDVIDSDVEQAREYELRHPDGTIDEFTDIGDAIDFIQNNGFKDSALFERSVTVVTIFHAWTEVSVADTEEAS